jgi:YesN/AraC family two-component response regulator
MKRILVVDDNQMMRKLIINLFNDQNFEFHEAEEGREGLEKMKQTAMDLIITDIIMPGMEGIEMIIQAKKNFPATKIIAISGGKPYYLYMAKKLGIEGVFTKPLDHHGFFSKVNTLLQVIPTKC